jgi:serine/threonine-protein kinase RsbW
LTEAIRAAYGDSYDAEWVYDPHEIAERISEGLLVSVVAEDPDGALLCHVALNLHGRADAVGHVGQAVTVPAARGQHLFTSVKRWLAALATERGLLGMYSEATAAHPYSQRANVELGAVETGFLLGWIPASVRNDAAVARAAGRESAALFYLRTNAGPARPLFAPERHREIVHQTIEACRLHARLAEPGVRRRLERCSTLHPQVVPRHNTAVVTVTEPGEDLPDALDAVRERLFRGGLDVLYVDLPLDLAATAQLTEPLEALGISYAGIFPNTRRHGDVLRLQSLNGGTVHPGDVSVGSAHGRALLDYILEDAAATGQAAAPVQPAEGTSGPASE